MKLVTIIGARPQFIKAAVVSREIKKNKNIKEIFIHTGQHYDKNMSGVFLKELDMKEPDYFLDINNLSHGAMTGRMMEKIEEILIIEKPDWVLVYGDTNSTLAGALAAKKLHIKVAHVEAGLRSFNNEMPEEINRILTDRISDILFCPTVTAVENLKKEGFDTFNCEIVQCGDVMLESAEYFNSFSCQPSFEVPREFVLVTIHRPENTRHINKLNSISTALNKVSKEIDIVFPVHPGTRKIIEENQLSLDFRMREPVSYLEMLYLLKKCALVITDSGGLQKEAFFSKKKSVTLRDETEWVELEQNGFTMVCGSDDKEIYDSYKMMKEKKVDFNIELFGKGKISKVIVEKLFFYS